MPFSQGEREDIRYYLGRSSSGEWVREWSTRELDTAIAILNPEAEARVRGLLVGLRSLEANLLAATGCASVSEASGAKFDPDRARRLLMAEGRRHVTNLARWLGTTLDPSKTPFSGESFSVRTQRG